MASEGQRLDRSHLLGSQQSLLGPSSLSPAYLAEQSMSGGGVWKTGSGAVVLTALPPCCPHRTPKQYVGSFPVDDLDTQEGVWLVQQQLWALKVGRWGGRIPGRGHSLGRSG